MTKNFTLLPVVLIVSLTSCVSTRVKMIKPNFEKVDTSKTILVFPVRQLSINDNQILNDAIIETSSENTVKTIFIGNLEWELRKLGFDSNDTSNTSSLQNTDYRYFLFIDLLQHEDAGGVTFSTKEQVEQRGRPNAQRTVPEEDELAVSVTLRLSLVSVITKNTIYTNIVQTHFKSWFFGDKDGESHGFNLAEINWAYNRSVKKGLIKMYNDCGIYNRPSKKRRR
jgi:hypothetical protein